MADRGKEISPSGETKWQRALRLSRNWDVQNGVPALVDWLGETLSQFLGQKEQPKKPEVVKLKVDNMVGVVGGVGTLASPNHDNEDAAGNRRHFDASDGRVTRHRFVVIDGSGGSLSHRGDIPEPAKVQMIQNRARGIRDNLLVTEQMRLDASAALMAANEFAKQDAARNPAYAVGMVLDVTSTELQFAGKGDAAAVLWTGQEFSHRRAPSCGGDLGGPSNLQLVLEPQNMAHLLKKNKMSGDGGPTVTTAHLDDVPEASTVYATFGDGRPGDQVVIPRAEDDTWVIMGTDGARLSGQALDPDNTYAHHIQGVMMAVKNRVITEEVAAQKICEHARMIQSEDDDVSVVVVKIPGMKKK